MLSDQGCAARRSRLLAALPTSCDFLVVGDPQNLIWLANFVACPFQFRSTEAGALLVVESGHATLLADNLLAPFLESAHVERKVAPTWYESRRSAPHRRNQLVATALEHLQPLKGRRIGVELGAVPAGVVEGLRSRAPDLEVVDIGPLIRRLRRAKDPDEVDLIRRSLRAAESGLAHARSSIRPGMTELEAFLILQQACQAAAGQTAIVYGDCVSGPRTERGGGPPGARILSAGDLLLLDFSVVLNGYRGDIANTFVVDAEPTDRLISLQDACLEAMAAGEAALRPGTPARAVDAAVRGTFAALGLAENFPSHSGHGLGLGHPEPPYFVPEAEETLVAGDVVALEPGQYIPGLGGMRFERNYLVTDTGAEVLSRHPLRLGPG